MSLLRLQDGKVVPPRPATRRGIAAELRARSDYRLRERYVFDLEHGEMLRVVEWVEPGTGVARSRRVELAS